MTKEAATNRARKHHGAHVPVLSTQVKNDFKGRSLAGDLRPRQGGFGHLGQAGWTG